MNDSLLNETYINKYLEENNFEYIIESKLNKPSKFYNNFAPQETQTFPTLDTAAIMQGLANGKSGDRKEIDALKEEIRLLKKEVAELKAAQAAQASDEMMASFGRRLMIIEEQLSILDWQGIVKIPEVAKIVC